MEPLSPPLHARSFALHEPAFAFRPFELLSAFFTFIVAASVYLFTLSPSITFGDSGELITAASGLGVAHPPGYPLWLLMAKLFSLLPIGSAAYRFNLFSALLDATAVGLLALLVARTLPAVCAAIIPRDSFDSPIVGIAAGSAAAAGALCVAFSPTFWQQSVSAEVYPLNNFLMCLILLLMALWSSSPQKNGLLFLTAFLFGLGLGNHQTLALLMPAAGLYVLLVRPKTVISPRALLGCGFLFLLGLCLYLYLPIRAAAHPPLNWGDPSTWDNFWFHVLRKQYRALDVVRPLSVVTGQVKFFFSATAKESIPLVLMAPFLITFAFASKSGRSWLFFTIAAFVCTGVLLVVIANTELDLNAQDLLRIYFLPPWLIAGIWCGYGIGVINLLALRASRRMRRRALPALLVAALWLLLPAKNLLSNYQASTLRGHDFARQYGQSLLNSMRQNAVLFAGTDSGYAIPMYMKWVQGRRPDISILSINRLSDLSYKAEAERNIPGVSFFDERAYAAAYSEYGGASATGSVYGSHNVGRVNAFLLLQLYRRLIPERPVYYDQGLPIEWIADYAAPSGLLMELKGKKIEALDTETVAYDTNYWNTLEENLLGDKRFLADTAARQKYSKCRSNIGYLYLRRGMYPEAEKALEQAIRFSDRNIEAYAFLALTYKEQGEPERAARIFNDYLRMDTWNTSARAFADSLAH